MHKQMANSFILEAADGDFCSSHAEGCIENHYSLTLKTKSLTEINKKKKDFCWVNDPVRYTPWQCSLYKGLLIRSDINILIS